MKNQKFDSRSGCVDYGNSYEYLMSAYYGLVLSFNDAVNNFKISVNNIDLGNFDDVILEITYNDGEQRLYALQLKHRGVKDSSITVESFNAQDGNFSLKKYCKGFLDSQKNYEKKTTYDIPFANFHFIVYTNQHLPKFHKYDANHKKVDTDEIQLRSKVTIYKYDKCVARGLLDLSETDQFFIYKFKNEENSSVEEDQFFQQFYLYTKQKDAKEIEIRISNFICALIDNCDPNVVTNFINFFKFWWRGDFGKFKLSKKDIMAKLAEYVLSPHIPDIHCKSLQYEREKFHLLKEFILSCDLTLVEDSGEVEEILWALILKDEFGEVDFSTWSQPFSGIKNTNLPEISRIPISAHGENFIKQSLKKIYIILWHMDRLPLFIRVHEKTKKQIYTAIKLCQNLENPKKIVALDENIENEEFGNVKIFRMFSDIDNEFIYQKFCDQIQVSLQGRSSLKLNQIIDIDDSFKNIIKVRDLIHLLKSNFVIGDSYKIPDHYINRTIPKILLQLNAIDEICNDIFVVSCEGSAKCNLKSTPFILSKYILLKENASSNQFPEKFYIFVNGICSSKEFRKICHLNKNKNCHHVKLVGSVLEWLESQGDITLLKPYKIDHKDVSSENFVTDSNILNYFTNKTNVLCATAGMGKSCLLHYLKSVCLPDFWVIYININNHIKFLRENHDIVEISYYFLKYETHDSFSEKFVEVLLIKRKILFLWDGFDELPSSCVSSVISKIKLLNEMEYLQWISARNNSKEYLENVFGLFALTVTPFSETDQQKYIYSHLKGKYNNEKTVEDMVVKLNKKMSSTLNCGYFDYVGIPLQIYMTLKIYLKNAKKYIEEVKIVILTDIYREYINGKFLELFDRANTNKNNFLMQKIQKKFKETQELLYETAAVKASFDEDASSFVNSDCEIFLEKIVKNKDKLGLIFGLNDDSKPIFSHKTYQEFLTASWLAKNYKKVPMLMEKLFEDDFRNTRLMFDMILAKDSPVHVAVLYRNIQILRECQKEVLITKDKGGRNPLHIACAWRTKHPPVQTVDYNMEKTVISVEELFEDYNNNVDIVELLISHGCDPFEIDELYQWNALNYCDRTLSLALLDHILPIATEFDLMKLSNFNDLKTVFYFSVRYNYVNLFYKIKDYPYLEILEAEDTRTLLHLAVKFNRTNFVITMLSFHHYKEAINTPYRHFGGPLFTAASNGNLDMFRLLQQNGAVLGRNQTSPLVFAVAMGYTDFCQKLLKEDQLDPNQCNIDGNSILQIAALRNYISIMKILIQFGANVHYVNYMDHTALDFAIDRRSVEGVKLLVEHGANLNRKSTTLYGYTPLHNASELENEEIVEFLLRNGADTKVKSNMLYTPLHVALINRRKNVARILIEADATVINEYSEEKSTPMTLAALEDYYDIIARLAELGADVNSEHSQDSPLRIATLKQFHKSVDVLIKCGASVNKPDKNGFTPLFYSISNLNILKLYLNNDSTDVNAKSFYSVTALHFAAQNAKIDAVEQLILHKADVNAKDSKNDTPLHYAIAAKDENIVKLLLRSNVKIEDGFSLLCRACVHDVPDCLLTLLNWGINVNVRDNQNRTALHAAASTSLFCTKILILKGADINIIDNFGFSPLCFAVFFAKIDIIEELIQAGGDLSIGFASSSALHLAAGLGDVTTLVFLLTIASSFNAQDADGRTPLHCVVEKNSGLPITSIIAFIAANRIKIKLEQDYEKCAIELLEKGSDATIENTFGSCPIVSVPVYNNLDMLELFCKKYGSEDKYANLWKQCLFMASGKDFLQIVQFLYEKDLVDINDVEEKNKMSVLHYACSKSAKETTAFLISKGANINAKMIDGSTPLYYCAILGDIGLVKLLVDNGAIIDIANAHGNTSLFCAANRGFLDVVQFLCDHGADVNVVDEDGDIPLHDAAASGHLSIVEYLVLKDSQVTCKNKNGKTPFDLARENKMIDVANFLEQFLLQKS